MLGRKYVFESKSTRLRRLLLSGLLLFTLITAVIGSFIVYIPIYAKMQKGRAAGAFFQKSPDAIAVFTGDKGRIAYALELLKKNPSSKLFISGVHAANSFQTLLEKQAPPATGEAVQNVGMLVDLDYKSRNTFENVRETVKFLKTNTEFKKVLIISSDYHIMRIKLIMSHYINGQKPELYFDSVSNSYSSWSEIKKLLKETVKISRTFVLMKILRENVVSDEDEAL
jgi:uncharacterized SAM-binding protein YcdF (DUF218 family)